MIMDIQRTDMDIQSYTLKEASKILKIHEETLRLKAKNSKIGSFRIGKEYRFTELDIKNFQDSNRG